MSDPTMSKQEQQLGAILDKCIERMGQGAGLDECLRDYPEHAHELRPLLALAQGLKGTMAVEPSAQGRAAGRSRLQEAMRRARGRTSSRAFSWLAPVKVWAAAALSLVVFGGGFGVVQASSDSVPGGVLYPVKRTVEEMRLGRPFQSRDEKARLSAELAARRANEMAVLARQNKTIPLVELATRVNGHVARVADLSEALVVEKVARSRALPGLPPGTPNLGREHALRSRLERDYQAGLNRLEAIASQAPPEARPHIQEAAKRLKEHYQEALERIDGQLGPHMSPTPEDGQKGPRPGPAQGQGKKAPRRGK